MSTTTSDDLRQVNEALAGAADTARSAPSVHNSQPWHWRVHAAALQLWAEPARQLPVTDPEGRTATISCGAALHHARVALAARGFMDSVVALPVQAQPDYLAQLTASGRRPVTPATMRLYQAISIRHTDRHPLTGEPISPDALLSITMAVRAHNVYLHILSRD